MPAADRPAYGCCAAPLACIGLAASRNSLKQMYVPCTSASQIVSLLPSYCWAYKLLLLPASAA